MSPAGFAAAQPDLAGYPLPLVCAALTVLHPGRPAVIARRTGHAIGGATSYVWLPAPSHALMLTPMARLSDADAVLLPRPLGGSWSTDPPVPVVAAAQVAQVCTHIAKGHIRLDAALTDPAADQPRTPTDPQEDRHAQP